MALVVKVLALLEMKMDVKDYFVYLSSDHLGKYSMFHKCLLN